MDWLALVVAGIFEMVGVAMIHRFNQYRNVQSFLLLLGGFGASFACLAYAMETLPMGTAYAVWTGIGASGGALVGMFYYGEPKNWPRILFISLVLGAAVGLKLFS